MSGTVNVGTIEALLKLTDQFTAPMKEVAARLDKLTDLIEKDLNKTDRAVDKLGNSFANLGREVAGNLTRYFTATAIVSGGIAALVSVTKQLATANIEAEASEKKVEEAVRRYGESSGVTASQINDLASEISKLTGIDDEAIADAETLALKYNRISTDILPRFTQAAVDLSVATGQDLPSAFEKAGKIVNQPLKGLTLLAREGYAVAKSQSDLVKSLVKSNDILGAQGVLLDILESQYGGAAAAARDSLGGSLTALGTTWENFLERIGQDKLGPLRQGVESLITLLENMTDGVKYVEIGFHYTRATVNGFISDTLSGIADIIDLLSDAAKLLGSFGVSVSAVGKEVSARARNAAKVAGEDAMKHGMAAATALAGLSSGHERGTISALEQTEAEAKLGKELNKLSDSINQSIKDLQRKADNARDLYLAALIGIKAYNAEVLKQKVLTAILQEENKLRETGGKLTTDQKNAISKAVIEEDHFNKKLQETLKLYELLIQSALTATDNISKTGFDKDFQRDINKVHEGILLIEKDVQEMLNSLDLKKNLDLDFDFSLRLSAIDQLEPHLRQIEEDYLNFLRNLGSGSVTEGERIFTKMAERFGWTIDNIKAKLSTLADENAIRDLRFSGSSTLDIYRQERAEINRLVKVAAKQDIDITEGATKKLNDLQSDFWDKSLSSWSSALSYLADEFGGLFNYLFQAVQTLQQAKGMKDTMTDIGGQMGMSSGAIAAMGAFGAFLVIAKAMYDEFERHRESRQMRRYDYGAVLTKDAGSDWSSPIASTDTNQQALAVSHQIQRTAEAFAESIGGTIRKFADLEIQIRKDGKYFRAIVEGELIGQFESMAEATSAALLAAFTSAATDLRGLSDLVKSGLEYLTSDLGSLDITNLEDAGHLLTKLREISELSWSDGAISTLEQVRHFDSLWAALNKLEAATPPVIQGFNDLITAELNTWRAWHDSITGRQKSQAELLAEKKADAVLFEAQKQFRIAELQLKKLDLETQYAYLSGKGKGLEAEGRLRQGELTLNKEFLIVKGDLFEAELTLNQQFLEALAIQINAITVLIQSLLDLPEINLDDIKIPKSGGKGNKKDNVKDWIDDKRFDLDTRGMDEYQRSVLEKEREYQDQLNELGKKDKALRAEIIALRERELALMAEERKDQVSQEFNDFVNQASAFEQVRKTASDLIDSINDSPFGDAEKASMIGEVLEEVERQIEQLSLESAANILGQMVSDLEQFGAGEALQLDVRRNLAIIEHTLRLAQYRTEIEILRQQGRVSDAVLATMDRSLAFLEGLDIDDLFGNGEDDDGSTDSGDAYNDKRDKINQAEEEYLKKIKEATDLLAKYKDQGIDPLTKELKKIKDDFIKIKEALGNTPEIINEENEAIKRAYQDALSGIQEFYNSLLNGADSALTVSQRYEAAQKEYMRILNEVQSGDYSELEDLDDAAQEFISLVGQMFGTSTGGFQEIKAQVLEQLGKLLNLGNVNVGGSTGSSASNNNIIQFPQQVIDNSRESITATNNVANVINIRSSRQEALLSQIVTELINIKRKLQEIDEDDDISYGN